MSHRYLAVVCLPTLLLTLLLTPLSFGQVESGIISGTVRDPTGAVVSGAKVTIKNVGTSAERTVHTNNSGEYTISGLPIGTYSINVSNPGFATFSTQAEVSTEGHLTIDANLAPGTATTTVEVVAGAAGTEVNTQTQEVSQLVDTQQMAQLPSLTRNPYDFVQVAGNVSNADNTTGSMSSSQNSTSRGVGYSINGQRMSGTEVLLDGVENIDLFNGTVGQQVPIDSVQEYRIVTNNFEAQYGRASGGVVNVSTKAGSNTYHGAAWEFNRLSAYTSNTYQNDALNANFLATGGVGPLPAPKGAYTRNQFGYELGGKIVSDKLFFYQSTEWTRVRGAAFQNTLIPTPQLLAVSAPNVQSYFNAFGANHLPIISTITDTAAGGLLGLGSTPVLGQVSFRAGDAGGDFPQNTYRLVARLDYNPTDRTQIFFRYGRESLDEFPGAAFFSAYPQYDVGQITDNNSGVMSLTHNFSPNLLSNTKVAFSRINALQATYNQAYQNVPNLMFGGATVNGFAIQFPGLENFMAPGAGGLPFGGPQNNLQLQEDMTWNKGRHTVGFGGQFNYIQLNKAFGAYAQSVQVLGSTFATGFPNMLTGTLQYFEAAINPQGNLPCPVDQFGNLPANTSSCNVSLPASAPNFSRSYRYRDWAVYAQDSWKVMPRLTVNYGVRYEHYGVQHNVDPNLDSNFYFGSGSTFFQQIRTGQVFIAPQSPIGQLWAPDWGTVAPRVGFAFDPNGQGKTSIRGGFGISYERNFGNVTFNVIQNPPAYAVLQDFGVAVSNSNSGPFAGGAAAKFPCTTTTCPLTPVELRAPNEHINTAQTQFWSLSVQHQVARNTIIEVAYNGAHGVHLYDITGGNPIGGGQAYLGDQNLQGTACSSGIGPTASSTFFNPFTGAAACYTRPNAQYAGINIRGSGGTSSYNAVNVRFQSHDLHGSGVSLIANYTYGHSLDDLSSTFSDNAQGGSGFIGNLGYLDPTHPKLDWGSSDFDLRQRVVVSPIWETPWFKNGRGLKENTLGGYSIVGIFTARTGSPFSAFDYTYNVNAYLGVPRIVPSTPVTSFHSGTPVAVGINQFQVNTIPGANDIAPFNPTLGLDDFGPFPANMIRRNSFRGPGAWNADLAASKAFNITERVKLTFRAEGFDIFNHHNYYINESALSVFNAPGSVGAPLPVIALKGGLNNIALGGNHDERRFGQFSLRLSF